MFQYETYFLIHAAFMKLIYENLNIYGIMELIYEFIRLILQSIKLIFQSTLSSISLQSEFPRLGRHQSIQLGVLREAVLKRHDIPGTADQPMSGSYICNVGQLVL